MAIGSVMVVTCLMTSRSSWIWGIGVCGYLLTTQLTWVWSSGDRWGEPGPTANHQCQWGIPFCIFGNFQINWKSSNKIRIHLKNLKQNNKRIQCVMIILPGPSSWIGKWIPAYQWPGLWQYAFRCLGILFTVVISPPGRQCIASLSVDCP